MKCPEVIKFRGVQISGFLGLGVEMGLTVNGDGCTFDKVMKNY